MEPSELIFITRTDFNDFLHKHPRFEIVLRDIIKDNIPDLNEHTRLLQIVSAKERYNRLAMMRPDIIRRVQLKHIASYLGMSSETISRVRRKGS
jgi:CRP-like cAMP-binding protein